MKLIKQVQTNQKTQVEHTNELNGLTTEQKVLEKTVDDNQEKLKTHEGDIAKLQSKQAAIISKLQAQEDESNKKLKNKIASLNNVQLKNSKDIVADVHKLNSNQAAILK